MLDNGRLTPVLNKHLSFIGNAFKNIKIRRCFEKTTYGNDRYHPLPATKCHVNKYLHFRVDEQYSTLLCF